MTIDDNDARRRASLPPATGSRRTWRRPAGTAALAAVLIAGAAVGAGAMRFVDRHQPQAVMLLQPAAVSTLRDNTPVAIKGKVANLFDDGTGRTLVDMGPRGEGRTLVTPDEIVTIQGRFEGGRLHAQVLMHADGRTEGFGPDRPAKGRRGPGHTGPDRLMPAPGDVSPLPQTP